MDRQAFALGDRISLRHLQNIAALNKRIATLEGLLAKAPDLFAHTVGAMCDNGDKENQARNEREAHAILAEIRQALGGSDGR